MAHETLDFDGDLLRGSSSRDERSISGKIDKETPPAN
jgi:hypothetical protein